MPKTTDPLRITGEDPALRELSDQEVRSKIVAALKLIERDALLLDTKHDVNERSSLHKLAVYLERRFPDWDVDCEYNRRGYGEMKMLGLSNQCVPEDDLEATTVFPDVIVHKRACGANLLVIEVKKSEKSTRKRSVDAIARDNEKLAAFRMELGFEYAVLLVLDQVIDLQSRQVLEDKIRFQSDEG